MKISAGFTFLLVFSLTAVFLIPGILYGTGSDAGPGWIYGLDKLQWRTLGPSLFGGRIADIAVADDADRTIYCAAATGGIWRSDNSGTTWEPVFDDYSTGSMGCLALDPGNSSVVWAGTGEVIAGSHTAWGDGIYKSEDGGDTWSHMGLEQTHYIGKIVVDPSDGDVIYAAAAGHLWGPNPERGLYKSEDGGRTWNQSLFINDKVGVVDVVMDPADSQVLYAAAYGRLRGPYSHSDVAVIAGSGIYKTENGGESWEKVIRGLPDGRMGRIGLAIAPSRPRTVYAVIERAPFEVMLKPEQTAWIMGLLKRGDKPDAGELKRLQDMIEPEVPEQEKAAAVVAALERGRRAQVRSLLGWKPLDTGGGVFRSRDSGRSWERMSPEPSGAAFYSRIFVHPQDSDTVFVPTQRMWISKNGGRDFNQAGWAFSSWLTSRYIHGDFHPFWIDPDNPDHFLAGTDGGLYSTADGGGTWRHHPMPIGQFYTVTADMRRPYYIWGGTQDNGGWAGPSLVRHITGISDYEWFKFEESDGGYVQVDPDDPMTVYSEWQYGRIRRLDLRRGTWTPIQPRSKEGDDPLRFHFIAPFLLSSHDSATLYMGAQRVMKTTDRGENWTAISSDLTYGDVKATVSTLSESGAAPGVLYAGTEDGRVHVTRDDGRTWRDVTGNIPGFEEEASKRLYVSRVEASPTQPETAYVSFDGHCRDDFGVYIFKTNDFGKTWMDISGNLPTGHPVRVIREDPVNPSLLFAGTSVGIWTSLDSGAHWFPLSNGMPAVKVDDLVIHPRDADLIAGTHGRGIYVLDITPLRGMTEEAMDSETILIPESPVVLWNLDITKNKGARGDGWIAAENPHSNLLDLMTARYVMGEGGELAPPGAALYYYLKEPAANQAEITIINKQGEIVRSLTGEANQGLNKIAWDLRRDPLNPPPGWQFEGSNDAVRLGQEGFTGEPGPLVQPGLYTVILKIDELTIKKSLEIFKDCHVRF